MRTKNVIGVAIGLLFFLENRRSHVSREIRGINKAYL